MLLGLTPEKTREALKEIKEESPAARREKIERVTEWIKSQPHMPQNFDERVISSMLRGCKNDLEKTKKKLDHYYCYRAKYPEFFSQRDPVNIEITNIKKCMSILPLPETTPASARVTLHRFLPGDMNEYDANSVYKLMMMIGDIRLVEEIIITGDVFIYDVKHLSLNHVAHHTGLPLKKALNIAQEAYPQRLKEIHIINAPPFVSRVINFCKQLMKEKMRDRFLIHDNLESLYRYVPKNILPVEYGGNCKTLKQLEDQWDKKLESYASYFIQQEGVKADERKRISAISNDIEKNVLGGTAGSFRKLCID